MLKHAALFLLSIFTFSAYALDTETLVDSAEFIAEGTYAKPVNRRPPDYPAKANRVGIEGWVLVNFSVKEDGTTDDIVVLNASIVGYFEKEAIRTVSTWTYQPATWNGNPVAQANMTASIIFTMTNSNVEVTGSFRSNFEKANTAILEGDLSSAKSIIDKLDSGKKKRLSEVCHLDMLKAAYWQSKGDNAETLHYVNRALVIADVAVSNEMYISLLRQAIAAEEASHNYISALSHYKTLLKVDGDISADDPIRDVAQQIEEVIGSDGAIVTNGKISQCADCLPDTLYWHHFLNRNRFSIAQVTGEVGEVEILCGFQSVSLVYNPEAILSVEKDWGQCYLRVFGEQGTTLQLTEF